MRNRIIQGDIREVAKTLEPQSVNCIITSPPYWGLRDYQTGKWEGGDPECDHIAQVKYRSNETSTLMNDGRKTPGILPHHGHANMGLQYKGICKKCGAQRIDKQLGMEATPEEYVENLVKVFRDLREAMRDDGTLWLNLGDSYQSNNSAQVKQTIVRGGLATRPPLVPGLKPKDLVGIPWMVAFALRSDGWYLRSDIIWHKPNPMPESVTDRPTKAHEYVFLLSKSSQYYYDHDAIREPFADSRNGNPGGGGHYAGMAYGDNPQTGLQKGEWNTGGDATGRNKRSVWTIPTKPYKETHFAVFPPNLVTPCLLAGCPPGGVVLDPFFGSGTVGEVAIENGRDYIGVELNPEYIKLAKKRIAAAQPPLFVLG